MLIDAVADASPLPSQNSRAQSALLRVVTTNSVMAASFVSITPLFLLSLGAEPFHIGLLAALTQVAVVAQLGGLRLTRWLGKARLGMWSRLLSLVPLGLLVVLGFSGLAGRSAVWLAVTLIFVPGMIISGGETSWWPLLQDNTTKDSLAHFFARVRLRARLQQL